MNKIIIFFLAICIFFRIFAQGFEYNYKIMTKIPLKDISDIRFGFYSKSASKGKYNYIQANYFDNNGFLINPSDSFINIGDKDLSHILQDGDVLFISKGFRYFAWCYHNDFGPAVASAIFFVIRPDINKVLPEYLTTFFNLPKNQEFFKQFGAGSSIPSIRKSELGSLMIPVLPVSMQKNVVALNSLYRKDFELSSQLLKYKTELYQSVISNILK